METIIDLTHLLNEDTPIESNLPVALFEFDPQWEYSFNVHDSGLNLTVAKG